MSDKSDKIINELVEKLYNITKEVVSDPSLSGGEIMYILSSVQLSFLINITLNEDTNLEQSFEKIRNFFDVNFKHTSNTLKIMWEEKNKLTK